MSEERPSSRALRERFGQEYALPLARALFELEPKCQSMLITVGQYWCDEATDAVHAEVLASETLEPTWPAAGQVHDGALGDSNLLAESLKDAGADGDEAASLGPVQWDLLERAHTQAFGNEYSAVLDDNSDMIVAFASYCHEVSDQEQPSYRSHTPYGLVKRPVDGAPLVLEEIGQMFRPEWEDRWDVLESDGIISGHDKAAESSLFQAWFPEVLDGEAAGGKPSPSYGQKLMLFLLLIAAIMGARALLGR